MRVHVVMGNDFPDAVYSDEKAAQDHCDRENAKNEKRKQDGYSRIYWRPYAFDLRENSDAG